MPNDNYASASEMIRSLDKIRLPHEVVEERGPFRLVRFERPFWEGYEFWLVNEKGFMWEGGDSEEELRTYLAGDEAQTYIRENGA